MINGINEYISIFWLMFIFPSEAIMPAVGFAVASNLISPPGAFIVSLAGTMASSVIIYFLSKVISQPASEIFIQKYGRIIGVTLRKVEKAGKWFDRHAAFTIFASRFIPALRSAACIPAGLARMPFKKFMRYAVCGSAIDIILLMYLGYIAGNNYDTVQVIMSHVVVWSLPAVIAAVGIWIIWHETQKNRHRKKR